MFVILKLILFALLKFLRNELVSVDLSRIYKCLLRWNCLVNMEESFGILIWILVDYEKWKKEGSTWSGDDLPSKNGEIDQRYNMSILMSIQGLRKFLVFTWFGETKVFLMSIQSNTVYVASVIQKYLHLYILICINYFLVLSGYRDKLISTPCTCQRLPISFSGVVNNIHLE